MNNVVYHARMKYEKSLKLAAVSFKLISISSLLLGLIILILQVGLLVIGAFIKRLDSTGLPSNLPGFDLIAQCLHSVSFNGAMLFSAIGILFLFFIFRNLSFIMELFLRGVAESVETESKLNSTVRFLVGLFVVDTLRIIFNTYYAIVFLPLLDKTNSSEGIPDWIENLCDFLIPQFSGTSALVLALLLFILARFLNEKRFLRNEVQSLKQETDLTI
jgi:hypothetical protein